MEETYVNNQKQREWKYEKKIMRRFGNNKKDNGGIIKQKFEQDGSDGEADDICGSGKQHRMMAR